MRVCRDAGVKRLILTHHDPLSDDDAIDRIVEETRARLDAEGSPLEVEAASEGLSIELRGDTNRTAVKAKNHFLAETPIDVASVARPVLLYLSDAEMVQVLTEAIAIEGIPFSLISDDEQLLRAVLEDQPSLVMIEHNPPQLNGIEIARHLRSGEGTDKIQVPVILVTRGNHPASLESGIATDWLEAPFTLSNARTKIRAWALRAAIRWIRAEIPADEHARQGGTDAQAIVASPPDGRFDRLTRIAAAAFDVPVALISLVEGDRHWYKSRLGPNASDVSRDLDFCSQVVLQKLATIVPDTLQDKRFSGSEKAPDGSRMRFYAGVPLLPGDGRCIGTFCIADTQPRAMSSADMALLHDLGALALRELKGQPG